MKESAAKKVFPASRVSQDSLDLVDLLETLGNPDFLEETRPEPLDSRANLESQDLTEHRDFLDWMANAEWTDCQECLDFLAPLEIVVSLGCLENADLSA